MRESFNTFVRRALDCIEQDAPACAVGMAKALADTRIVARVDEETTVFWCDGCRPRLDDRDPGDVAPDERTALLETTRGALSELLSGGTTLLRAVRSNAVRVRAPSATAARLFDAMRAFVEGVARSRDATSLYEQFQGRSDDR
jgi:hypothetical protein